MHLKIYWGSSGEFGGSNTLHSPFPHLVLPGLTLTLTSSCASPPPPRRGTRSLFLESSRSFSGPQSCFVYTVFTFKFKVSIILTMMQWNYQLTKQNGLFCELLELCYYSTSLTLKFAFSLLRNGPLGLLGGEKGNSSEGQLQSLSKATTFSP